MQCSSSRLNDTPRGFVKSNYARCMVVPTVGGVIRSKCGSVEGEPKTLSDRVGGKLRVAKTPSSIRINNLCRAAAGSVTCYIGDLRMPMEFSLGTRSRSSFWTLRGSNSMVQYCPTTGRNAAILRGS